MLTFKGGYEYFDSSVLDVVVTSSRARQAVSQRDPAGRHRQAGGVLHDVRSQVLPDEDLDHR